MSKATYFVAAFIVGFTLSAQAQSGAKTKFTPSYTSGEVEASNQMSPEQTMSQRTQVLTPRLIPNPLVTLEATAGYVNSNFSGGDSKNGKSISAVSRMQGGAGVLIGRGMWQIESGLFYVQRGAVMESPSSYLLNSSKMDFTLSYIEIPLMARFNWPHSSRSHFFARGGLVIGLLTDAKYDLSSTAVASVYGSTGYTENGKDGKDFFNTKDYRAALGVGYDWKLARYIGLVIQADVQQSISKINADDVLSDQDMYNLGIALSAGISIKL